MRNIFYENKNAPFQLSTCHILTSQPHLHKELEIIYVLKGGTVAWADRKSYTLSDGDLFLSFPNQIHYYNATEHGEYILIIPNAEILFGLKEILYDNIPVSNAFTPTAGSGVPELLKKMIAVEGEYKDTVIAGMLNQLFGMIMPHFKLKPYIKTDNSTLKDVLKYCTHNFAENITLDDLSEHLHLSKYHISHLFNEKLNINFNTYLNMLRINEACNLLEDTDKKIADISEETGFGSIRSFNRAFTDIMNVTPSKYRALYK